MSQAVESIQTEDESAKLYKRRIKHLKEHSSDQPVAASILKKKHMDHLMVEQLLWCSYYNTTVRLAQQSSIKVCLCWGRGSNHGQAQDPVCTHALGVPCACLMHQHLNERKDVYLPVTPNHLAGYRILAT